MAFTKGTAKLTNASSVATEVALTSGQLAYFSSGTAVFVQSQGQLIEAVGLPKDGSGNVIPNQFLLREPWDGATGTYEFVAFDTIEGLRDAVQSAKGFSEQLKTILDSVSVSPNANSLSKRTDDGRIKTADAIEADDAVALGQTGSAYSRDVGSGSGDIPEYVAGAGLSNSGYGGSAAATGNINTLTRSGFYQCSGSAIGTPVNVAGSVFHTEIQPGDFAAQIYVCYGGSIAENENRIFVRHKDSGVWEAWHEFFTNYNLSPVSVDTTQTITGIKTFNTALKANATHGKSISDFNAINDDANRWNSTGNYTAALTGSNNAMAFLIGDEINDRNGVIQVGHASSSFASATGNLWLNRYGGTVATGSNFTCQGDATANSFIESSDARLKANGYEVRTHNEILDVWATLRAKFFQWNKAIDEKGEEHARFHAGWMAQEIEQALVESGLGIDAYGLICKEPVYEERETGEVEEYQAKVTETVEESETQIQVIDGVPTQITTTKEKQVECCDMIQVVDEAGNGLTEKIKIPIVDENDEPVLDEKGSPTYDIREEPITYPVPRMETKTRPVTQQVIVDYKYRLRYTQCLILETAYLRRELERLKTA